VFVGQLKVGIGSCAILGENIETIGLRSLAFGALNVESQCSWAVVQSYTAVADMLLCSRHC